MWLIGIPNALLWGVLATVLRFVPYVGPFIAALFPVALAVAVAPGWGLVFWTVALFVGLELVSNNVVEPWLYGASTGVSTVAILVAAIFWTSLWGPVGLLLSTPITVCLAVLGRYVPHLGFFDVLLGSEPVLTPPERFYQRMLAGDPEEGEEIAEEFLDGRPLAAFYDEVALPALRLAEADRQRKVLVGERRALVTDSLIKVVGELADHEEPDAEEVGAGEVQEAPPVAWAGKPVLCVAGRTGLDRAAAAMLAQLLERRGIGARVLPTEALSPEGVAGLDPEDLELVCLSYLGSTAVAHARQACRRLRRRAPDARLLVGLWGGQLDEAKDGAAAAEDGGGRGRRLVRPGGGAGRAAGGSAGRLHHVAATGGGVGRVTDVPIDLGREPGQHPVHPPAHVAVERVVREEDPDAVPLDQGAQLKGGLAYPHPKTCRPALPQPRRDPGAQAGWARTYAMITA